MAKKVTPSVAAPRHRAKLAAAVLGALALSAALVWRLQQPAPPAPAELTGTIDLAGTSEQFQKALTAARAKVSAEPASATALAALGRLYHANNFPAQAEACWRQLAALQPREGRWPYYLADLARTAADEANLGQWLEKTVAIAPDYAPAWLELGELNFKTGQLEAAERAYRRRVDLTPNDPYARLGLARIALQRGQRAEGKRQLEEIIRDTPDFPSARNYYAELLGQENDQTGAANQRWLGTVAGRFRASADPWKEELRASCYDADQLIVWGEIDLQTKQGDLGRAALERAVQVAPRLPRAYEKLGSFYLKTDQAERAVEVLAQGWQLPGASELLCLNLSDAFLGVRRPTEALRVIEEGLQRMPDSSLLLNGRGRVLAAMDRKDEALQAYHDSMQKAPSSPEPVVNLGLLLVQLGRRDEGIAELKRALELQPLFAKALIALARIELEAGRPQAAAQYVFPYFQQFPGLRGARELMGQLYVGRALEALRNGDSTAAEQLCREGLSIVPDSAPLNGFLGVQYLQQRKFPEALQLLETSYRLEPGDARAVTALSNVYVQLGRTEDARRILTAAEERARNSGAAATATQMGELLRRLAQ